MRGFEIPTKEDSLAHKHNKSCVIWESKENITWERAVHLKEMNLHNVVFIP